jgi:hypothetical protein
MGITGVEVEDGSDDAELAADRVEVDVTQRLGEEGSGDPRRRRGRGHALRRGQQPRDKSSRR